jgi:GNAT superfamily N-acetyltransferase
MLTIFYAFIDNMRKCEIIHHISNEDISMSFRVEKIKNDAMQKMCDYLYDIHLHDPNTPEEYNGLAGLYISKYNEDETRIAFLSVVFNDDNPVAVMVVTKDYKPTIHIYVLSDYRHQGLGHLLLKTLKNNYDSSLLYGHYNFSSEKLFQTYQVKPVFEDWKKGISYGQSLR